MYASTRMLNPAIDYIRFFVDKWGKDRNVAARVVLVMEVQLAGLCDTFNWQLAENLVFNTVKSYSGLPVTLQPNMVVVLACDRV